MPKISIDRKRCKRCGLCAEICPNGVLVQTGARVFPKILSARVCSSCGHCVDVCPEGAISHSDFDA
jgi:formate hydrogenlyase subunit 6/NADH:ubiquinone oxidoreductase subunit I